MASRAGRIELRGRLVEHHDVRAHRDDARDRHALLLAAGQRERLAVGEVRDAEPREDRVDPGVHLRPRHREVLEPERELLANGQLRGGELVGGRGEDDPDAPEQVLRLGLDEVGLAERRAAFDRGAHDPWDEARRQQREGRLAGAGPPRHADSRAGGDREADVARARRLRAAG